VDEGIDHTVVWIHQARASPTSCAAPVPRS